MGRIANVQLAAKVHKAADFGAVQEMFHSRGWTDGLPIVPPTEESVAACLEWAMLAPDHLIGTEPVRERPVTATRAPRVSATRAVANPNPELPPTIITLDPCRLI